MAVTINASTSAGLVNSADTSGDLNIQSGGSTKIAVTSAGVAVTGLSKASLPTGSVLQVVRSSLTSQVTTSSSTYSALGLSATIVPVSATSKLYIFVNLAACGKLSGDTALGVRLLKNASTTVQQIDETAARTGSAGTSIIGAIAGIAEETSGSTSSRTYDVYINSYTNGQAVYVGNALASQATSSLLIMEIAA
jgi:hypothetical protein